MKHTNQQAASRDKEKELEITDMDTFNIGLLRLCDV